MDSAQIPGLGRPGEQLKLTRFDLQGLGLSPQEVWIASRLIEGPLTAEDLVLKSGLPRTEVIEHLSRLVSTGVLQKVGVDAPPHAAPAVVASPAPAGFAADPQAVDLSPERQREITDLLIRVATRDPRVLLGVSSTADLEEIKSAYLRLSQRFHPDQFFRKRLGGYKAKVDELFNEFTLAFQKLMRPPEPEAVAPPPVDEYDDEEQTEEEAEARLEPIERLKRLLFRGALDEAQEAFGEVEFIDPDNIELPRLRLDLKRRRDEVTAVEEYQRGAAADKRSDYYSAFRYYSLAASLDPRNHTYVERAARSLLYQGEYKEAKRLAERAVELNPNDPEVHATLANVFLRAGLEKNARREFERVLELSPKHTFAKSQLRKLRWKF
jgi:tetratricopeptide (TPR) repeat protein